MHTLKQSSLRQVQRVITRIGGVCFVVFVAAVAVLSLLNGTARANDNTEAKSVIETPSVIKADVPIANDSQLEKRLESIFAEIDSLATITLTVNSGVVTLFGEVDSGATREQAIDLASQLENVVQVESALSVTQDVGKRVDHTVNRLKDTLDSAISLGPLLLIVIGVSVLVFWLASKADRLRVTLRQLAPNAFIGDLLVTIARILISLSGLIIVLLLLDATAIFGTVLGAAGIVGLAIGFAVKDTVENYIASILLSLRHPFSVADYVSIDGHEGSVARLTSRATILISADGNQVRIPNAIVFKSVITNYTRQPERRFKLEFTIVYLTQVELACRIVNNAVNEVVGILDTPAARVSVSLIPQRGAILTVHAWVNQKQHDMVSVKSAVALSVVRALTDIDIKIYYEMPAATVTLSESRRSLTNDFDHDTDKVMAFPDTRSVKDASSISDVGSAELQDMSTQSTTHAQIKTEQEGQENLLSSDAKTE